MNNPHSEWLQITFFGNNLPAWFLAVLVFFASYIGLQMARTFVLRNLKRLSANTTNGRHNLVILPLKKTSGLFLLIVATYVALSPLDFPEHLESLAKKILVIAFLCQAALWMDKLVTESIQYTIRKKTERDASSIALITVMGFVGRMVVWSLLVLLALDNLGFDITALIAGLGIGGVAVALAAQNILGDLFASVSIVLDKPFVVGDFIIVDDLMGSVEYIGVKTTRLRSLSGEQLVFSNNDLLRSRIRNYKRMYERRVVFKLGVVYQTPHGKLAAISGILREIVEKQENIRFDRAHFASYGDFALIYEIVYYVKNPDYNFYMDTQQAINLEIYRRFQEQGTEFAYPTQTLFLEGLKEKTNHGGHGEHRE
jgi:small-conductance mechanosensitive channel